MAASSWCNSVLARWRGKPGMSTLAAAHWPGMLTSLRYKILHGELGTGKLGGWCHVWPMYATFPHATHTEPVHYG